MKATPLYRRASLLGGQAALEPVSGGRVQMGKSMSKSIQKTMQNQWKIEVRGPQNQSPEESQRGLGRVLAVLRVCIIFIGFRGGSWVRLVGQKTPTWPQLGTQDGTQIGQKSMPKCIPKIEASWTSIFGVF